MAGVNENSEIAKIIVAATPANSWADVTVEHLNNFKASDIKLDTVLKRTDEQGNPINVKIWDVLDMAVTDLDDDGIEISELSNFDYDGILLNKVMPYDNDDTDGKSNNKLYEVLFDVTGKTYDTVSLGDLSDFDTANIKINTVIPKTNDNKELYNILIDITKETDYTKITLSSLTSFSVGNLHLETVLGESINATLKSVLCEALNKTTAQFGEILVSDLGSNAFDIGNVKLATVMKKTTNDSYGNAILDTLLNDTANPVTLSNVGARISGLSLYEAYGKECFKPIETPGVNFIDKNTLFALEYIDTDDADNIPDHFAFVHEDEQYFIDNPGAVKYSLCADDGIWLLLCFKGEQFEDQGGVDTDGRPERYVVTDYTLGTLENGAANLSQAFRKATIQQLIDAGIIPAENYNQRLYTLNLLQAVAELSKAFNEAANRA